MKFDLSLLCLLLGCTTDDKVVSVETGMDSASPCRDRYWDADGDGYAGTPAYACDESWPELSEDCDDENAAVSPSATEDCATEIDDNCDGSTNATDALGCTEYFADSDGDGYGGSDTTCLCAPESPYVAEDWDDCDDTDAEVYPGGGHCGVWGDNSLLRAHATFIGDSADDLCCWFGDMGADIDGDGSGDILLGSPRAAFDGTQGVVSLFTGLPVGTTRLSDATAILYDDNTDPIFGIAGALIPDMDGDGYGEILVNRDVWIVDGEEDRFVADFISGPVTGILPVADLAVHVDPTDGGDIFNVGYAGDVNDDGLGDVWLVGQLPGEDEGVYLLEGPVDSSGDLPTMARTTVTGLGFWGGILPSLSASEDVNGDGTPDLLVVSAHSSTGSSGAIWLVLGPAVDGSTFEDADAGFVADDPGTLLSGSMVAAVDDTDGDGNADILLGIPYSGPYGQASLFPGSTTGVVSIFDAPAQVVGGDPFDGDGEYDVAGHAVAGLGDQNHDGYGDIGVAMRGSWLLHVYAGPLYGTYTAADSSGRIANNPTGETVDDGGTDALASADINHDGWTDVLVGTSGATIDATDQGAAWLFYGGGGP